MKIAKLMCASAMILALAACGSAGEEPQDKAADAAAVEAEAVSPAAPAEAVDAAAENPAAEATAQAPEAAPDAVPAITGATPAQAASSGPPDSFLVCSACHAVVPGKNGIGPSLAGIVGKKAASVPGFAYSDALKNANVTWTDAALDKWLQAPMKMVPGTRMVFGGITDAAKRKELIDYMKTL